MKVVKIILGIMFAGVGLMGFVQASNASNNVLVGIVGSIIAVLLFWNALRGSKKTKAEASFFHIFGMGVHIFLIGVFGLATLGGVILLLEEGADQVEIILTLTMLLTTVVLCFNALRVQRNRKASENTISNLEAAIYELADDMADSIKIVTPPLTAQQQRDYEAIIEAERNSPNPKFHRTEQEEDLSFQFQQSWGNQVQKLEAAFDDKYGEALQAADYDTTIFLLRETITLYHKAKTFCYNKSKGGQIYFQDMWEFMHNSSSESFSFEDQVIERIEYYEQMIKLEKELIDLVKSQSGSLLQKEMYQQLLTYGKGDIQKAIRRLENEGVFSRERKGSTYILSYGATKGIEKENDMALFKNKDKNIMDRYEHTNPKDNNNINSVNTYEPTKDTSLKWYLQTWFIAILFALWWLFFPPIIGIVLIIKQSKIIKSPSDNAVALAAEERDRILKDISQLTMQRGQEKQKILDELHTEIKHLKDEIFRLTNDRDSEKNKLLVDIKGEYDKVSSKVAGKEKAIESLNAKISQLSDTMSSKTKELVDLEGELAYQDFGIYRPKYNCISSDEYKEKIKEVRDQQKNLITNKDALSYYDGWTLDGSRAKGRAMNNDNMKIVLLAFNGECDSIIGKVKFNNVERIEDRIKKTANKINKLNERNKISIKQKYISLKIEELYLAYEYEQKKQEEKEEIRRIREDEREAQKLAKELEDARKDIDKEKNHYDNALEKAKEQLLQAGDAEKELLLEKIADLEARLGDVNTRIAELDYREANTRAGYVYVISNIGSFGQHIYKIGMTRRLDPMDRVNELGDASVPFKFDVHAMIFSDDAPKLESALHNAFDSKKINMVNGRKEFFNVTLEEIEAVIKQNYEKTVEFNRDFDAEEYRETQMLKKQVC